MNKFIIVLLMTISGIANAANIELSTTSSNIGVGTIAQSGNKLDVNGNTRATTFNKVTLTQPASSATLTVANGKTLTASNTLTLAGTDSTTMTFPTTTATIARTDATNTFTGNQIVSSGNVGVGSATPSEVLDVNGNVRASAFISNATTAGLVQLYEASANGSNYINWTSASSLSTDVEYTLPSTLGTAGQVFTLSNGTGGINWSSVPAGSGVSGITTNKIPLAASSTTLTDSNMNQQGSTNIGISTTGPQSLFAVGSTSQFQVNSSGAIAASTGITTSGGYTQSGTTANTFTGTPTFSNATYALLTSGTGNVGINSATPGVLLDVNGAIRSTGSGVSVFGSNVGIGTSVGVPNALYVVGTPMFTTGLNIGIGTASPTRLCIANNAIATCN